MLSTVHPITSFHLASICASQYLDRLCFALIATCGGWGAQSHRLAGGGGVRVVVRRLEGALAVSEKECGQGASNATGNATQVACMLPLCCAEDPGR